MWRTIRGERVQDLHAFISEVVKAGDKRVHVGTDSQQRQRTTQFVTVVAILTPGKGGRALYRRIATPRIASLRERLLREVWLSVDLALEIDPLLPESAELTVHIDANPVVTHRSSRYVQELTGMVVSQGFRAAIKPAAWAATCAADRLVRGGFTEVPAWPPSTT